MSLQKGGTLDPDMHRHVHDKIKAEAKMMWVHAKECQGCQQQELWRVRHKTGPTSCPQKEPRLVPCLWGDGVFLLFKLPSFGYSAMVLLGKENNLTSGESKGRSWWFYSGYSHLFILG